MLRVLKHASARPLEECVVLTVGSSTGIIDARLAETMADVIGVDIDAPALDYAARSFPCANLRFVAADAMALPFPDALCDVVICSQVYEHVADAGRLLAEIHRVLKPGGLCYFAANNRLMWMEPHYRLPLLSVLPRALAHVYLRLARRGSHYYERHYTYWSLRRLVSGFRVIDYTRRMIEEPSRYAVEYLVPAGAKGWVARTATRWLPWLVPGYVWVLVKPDPADVPPRAPPAC